MILNYKTGKLPPNFIYLGVMLFGISIWRMIVFDWVGILFFIISLLLLFIKSGIIIDVDNRKLKKYIGLFSIKKGDWVDIKSLNNIKIFKTKATQSMSVLSISRTEINEVYKLLMILSDKNIEIMSGGKDHITKVAKEISSLLQTKIIK